MSQTTYGFAAAVANAGDTDSTEMKHVDSYAAEGACGFGLALIQGTTDKQAKLCDSASGKLLGVALRTHTVINDGSATGYADKDAVSVLRHGRVWMETAADATKEAAAYIVVASGADRGKVTPTATNNLGPIGKYVSAGLDGELCVVELT
jgi:hypothetical protein